MSDDERAEEPVDQRIAGALIAASLPASVLHQFLTGGGAFLQPGRLHQHLTGLGLTQEAQRILEASYKPGFWTQLAHRCMPNVRTWPAHIGRRVADGTLQPYVLPDNNRMSQTDSAWLAALQYFLTVIEGFEVRFASQGAEHNGHVHRFEPSMSLADEPLATCADYVDRTHTIAYTYDIVSENVAGDNDFDFTLNIADAGGGDGWSDDEIDTIGVESMPALREFNALRDNNGTVSALIESDGVTVHEQSVYMREPYASVVDPSFSVRWRVPGVKSGLSFATSHATLEAKVHATLDVHPWRIDDDFLWAVAVRQQQAVDAVYTRLLRLRVIVQQSDGVRAVEKLFEFSVDVDPRTRIITEMQSQGNHNDIDNSVYAIAVGRMRQRRVSVPDARDSRWEFARTQRYPDDPHRETAPAVALFSPSQSVGEDRYASSYMVGELSGNPLHNSEFALRWTFHVSERRR